MTSQSGVCDAIRFLLAPFLRCPRNNPKRNQAKWKPYINVSFVHMCLKVFGLTT